MLYNRSVTSKSGARSSRDAMPLGSGRAAVNAWVDTKGLAFYLADAPGGAADDWATELASSEGPLREVTAS